ncbi:MAG: hypothetical protein BWY82_02805 [Verrucomicrobia bacterium ADurb.Bin474]|nr:MAG: hypothetical protein BWY82_02805 [Verrucomicrobia bacterium ADurb.Bin474]
MLQNPGQILPLTLQDSEPFPAFSEVLRRGVNPLGLLTHVIDFQGEDRQAVNDHTWRLRIHRHMIGIRLERLEQGLIHAFNKVIALLIVAVDRPLRMINVFEAHVIPTGTVFLMPQVEVASVIGLRKCIESIVACGCVWTVIMPLFGPILLQVGDILSADHATSSIQFLIWAIPNDRHDSPGFGHIKPYPPLSLKSSGPIQSAEPDT